MQNLKSTILWDFDGTLAYREGMWSGVLIKVLDDNLVSHGIKIEDIRPFLKECFPWHYPEKAHHHLSDSKKWWSNLEKNFIATYQCLGIDRRCAIKLAKLVRHMYIDPAGFTLYGDTVETLRYFYKKGWSNIILSNHVPELSEIVDGIGIGELIDHCITSARIGYEKPNKESFQIALEIANNPEEAWMVGDNRVADIEGAEAVGLKAILVRQPKDEEVKYYSRSLAGVIDIIEQNMKNCETA